MISWKNPTPEMKNTSMDDYLLRGALTATEVARTIAKTPAVHAIGYCIGGTLLTALLAWLQAEPAGRAEKSIRSWSLFATLTDFSHPGDIDVFISTDGINHLERMMEAQGGFLSGRQLADTFRIMRSNSLVWHYFVHNYLYGKEPPSSTVLAWNMDTTRLPATMHSFYLREFYLKNKLVKPNAIKLGGRGIDIGKIDRPLYMVAAEQDHITPWQQTFKLCSHIHAPVRHVLATSGHILGIVSPPVEPPKRRYWVGDASCMSDPELWRSQCPKVPGSWWEDWDAWLAQQCGALRAAAAPGSVEYPPIEPAPGQYIREH